MIQIKAPRVKRWLVSVGEANYREVLLTQKVSMIKRKRTVESLVCPRIAVIRLELLVYPNDLGWNHQEPRSPPTSPLLQTFMSTMTFTELSAHCWDKGPSETDCGNRSGEEACWSAPSGRLPPLLAPPSATLEPPVRSAALFCRSWVPGG